MLKWWCGIPLLCLLLNVTYSLGEEGSSNFPKNDFSIFLNDLWRKLGVEKACSDLGKYMGKSIRDGMLSIFLYMIQYYHSACLRV